MLKNKASKDQAKEMLGIGSQTPIERLAIYRQPRTVPTKASEQKFPL